jgi:hypothetical protein
MRVQSHKVEAPIRWYTNEDLHKLTNEDNGEKEDIATEFTFKALAAASINGKSDGK